ncbi:type II toxin-antitoxin system RelE/ParE family toxin [Agrobacterium pusense]|uniref:type II toxin-antitoxin system RelE/ParE family toxin n=1 Tax=Agrobacterium pusense TaxID=648995 RepID=UPI003FD54A98
MTIKLFWSPRARSDVKKIYIDIGKLQPLAAERYYARFRAKAERLIDHPHLGERHPEIFPSARMLVEAPYIILYETVPDTDGDKIRVIDGRRDLKTLF